MIYPSSLLSTPATVLTEFKCLVFNFLWNDKDKVTRRSTCAPYDSGGLKMIDYETIVRALRLRWLKRIVDHCRVLWFLEAIILIIFKQQGRAILP